MLLSRQPYVPHVICVWFGIRAHPAALDRLPKISQPGWRALGIRLCPATGPY